MDLLHSFIICLASGKCLARALAMVVMVAVAMVDMSRSSCRCCGCGRLLSRSDRALYDGYCSRCCVCWAW